MTEQESVGEKTGECPECHAVILAGGSGTRLWPLSRNLLPKQLMALDGETTLLQQTVERVATVFPPERIWIVTNEDHVFEVRKQVTSVAKELDGHVLAEPMGRNTLPAIMLALEKVLEGDGEKQVAVFPSDHLVRDAEKWGHAVEGGCELASQGHFVTFGVKAVKPETGYGYITVGEPLGDNTYTVEGFVEKPDFETAQRFVADGSHLWNSGMFLFDCRQFLRAVARHQPVLWDWWLAREERPLVDGYGKLPDVSVDYGIVEHIDNIAVVAANFGWDDLGSWEAMYRLGDKDADGNVIQGDVLAMDCENCLLISKGGKLAVVGLRDMIMVQTRDATLSCPLPKVQRVKELVDRLKMQGSQLVESHPMVHRPWGSYIVLEEGDNYKIKRLVVNPGANLSSQMHHHRSEHWAVIKGTARVEIDHEPLLLVENQTVDIPKASQHRLGNPGRVPLEIIEIQSGPYLEEDDIVRFDDVYGRVKPRKEG